MKFCKIILFSLLTLCVIPLSACQGNAKINVYSRFDQISWQLQTSSVRVGDEIRLDVKIEDGYEGEIGVYVNGKKASLKNGMYTFVAQDVNNVEIDGDIFESIKKVEFPHKTIHYKQDFTEVNDSLTVYYETGRRETIKDYEVSSYPNSIQEQRIVLTFIGGYHEYKYADSIAVVDDEGYLQYVKDRFSAAIERDGVDALLVSNLFYTACETDGIFYYEDEGQRVWIRDDGMGYVALKGQNEYLSHKFDNMKEAYIGIKPYMPRLQFNVKESASATYGDLINKLDFATLTSDESENVILSQGTASDRDGTYDFIMDKSLEFLVAFGDGTVDSSVTINSEPYVPALPDVQWKEFVDENG